MNPEPAIEAMRDAARALRSAEPREQARAIQAAQDALDAAKAECLAAIEVSKAYEIDGASTLATWVHHQLRVSTAEAADLVRAAATCAALPKVAEAAAAGSIRTEHVAKFTYGLRHIGVEIMVEAQEWLLKVAETNDPNRLFKVIRALRRAHFPEDLDNAYERAWTSRTSRSAPCPRAGT